MMKNKIIERIKKDWFLSLSIILYLSLLLFQFLTPTLISKVLSCGKGLYFSCLLFTPVLNAISCITLASFAYFSVYLYFICKNFQMDLFEDFRNKTYGYLRFFFLITFIFNFCVGFIFAFHGGIEMNLFNTLGSALEILSGFWIGVLYLIYSTVFFFLRKTIKMHQIKIKKYYYFSLVFVLIPTSIFFFWMYATQNGGSFGQGIYGSSELGSDTLSHFHGIPHLIYDTERRAGYNTAQTKEEHIFGFATVVSGSSVIVTFVQKGSSADQNGLVVGDEISFINGTSTEGMSENLINDTTDKEETISLEGRRSDGEPFKVVLKKGPVEVPGSLSSGSISVKNPKDPNQLKQAVQDVVDNAEYKVNLAPRAIPLAIFGWILLDITFLFLFSPIVNKLTIYRKRHKVLAILATIFIVPITVLLVIVAFLFIPPLYTMIYMGIDNETCHSFFICFSPGPFVLFGGWLVLSIINLILTIHEISKNP